LIFPALEHCLLWSQQVDAELPGLRRQLVWTRAPGGERAVILSCADGSPLTGDGRDVLCGVAGQHGLRPSAWPPPTLELPPALLRWHQLVHGDPAPGERIETRAFAPGQPPVQVFSPTIVDAARAELRSSATHNTYAGMALRGPVLDGSADNCVAARCLWAEVDLKHARGDRTALLRYLLTFPLRLPVIIFSGGGYHIQVPLAQPVDLYELGMPERVERLNRHLAHALGNGTELDNVADIPRILRPPCTRNYKYSPAPWVEIVRLDEATRYTLDEVETWLAEHSALPAQPGPPRHRSLAHSAPSRNGRAPAAVLEGVTLPVPRWLRERAAGGAPAGERNSRGFVVACRLVEYCGPSADARAMLDAFARACRPPLEQAEVDTIWRNAQRAQPFDPPLLRSPLARGRAVHDVPGRAGVVLPDVPGRPGRVVADGEVCA
jgi:hypothetical protein